MNAQQGWDKFIALCAAISDQRQLEAILKVFLTSEEQKAISTRTLIIEELCKNTLSQRDMAAALQVSIAKITRGSNFLKTVDPALKDFIQQQLANTHDAHEKVALALEEA